MKIPSIVSVGLFAGLTILIAASPAVAETAAAPVEPLELRKIMWNLSKEMQLAVDGIVTENWRQVEQAAMRIADHPGPPPAEKARIMAFMGSDMGQFKAHDDKTHNSARELAEVAAKEDADGVISSFSTLQETCLACHQSFRKPIQQHFYGQQ